MHTLDSLRAGELAGCRRLKLACGLTDFPRDIFALADSLEILDLSGNALSTLPDDLPRLGKLRIIFCSDNQFTELPTVLGRCPRLEMIGFKANRIVEVAGAALPPALRWLILTDNRVAQLPPEIGRCTRLQKLMLAGNRLHALPPEMAACRRLELLRIAANQLPALPGWLLELPRLAWLAYAGNPCAAEPAQPAAGAIASIPWSQLALTALLGEGASGVIHRADWQVGEGCQAVALKLFKGAMTSDGLPHNEMLACLQAGQHGNLIPLLGRVEAHPAGAEALVMRLIDPAFQTLAGPPSLDSCTRDVYADDTRFSLDAALRLAHGIASAVGHLHGRGIVHGDLYAHNILHAGDGRALLGDFGAASFFDPADEALAAALQRLEVRAFACLLEELLGRLHRLGESDGVVSRWQAVHAACAVEAVRERPSFAQIEAWLGELVAGWSA